MIAVLAAVFEEAKGKKKMKKISPTTAA